MKTLIITLFVALTASAVQAQFAPAAGELGTTAIHKDSSAIIEWATEVVSFNRGLEDIENPDGLLASFGAPEAALGYAEGNSTDVVSLGDNGSITLTFAFSFQDGEGDDFAVFENSFSNEYLELAHVEVSSDGERFVRIPSVSNTPTDEQTETFDNTDPTLIYNLAGKYRQGFGTPFDLADIADSTGIDLTDVKYVRIIDVVGSIDPAYGSMDSEGNLINDPYKTDFESGGFDLDAVGIINSNNASLSLSETENSKLLVYPNPTNGEINIQASVILKQLVLMDLTGRIIYEGTEQILDLNQFNLNSGSYILHVVDSDDKVHQERINFVK